MNDTIPDDCMLNVFRYFTASQLIIAGFVCRRWFHLSEADYLWKRMLKYYYTLNYECLEHWSTIAHRVNWKTIFKGMFLFYRHFTNQKNSICSYEAV